MNKTRITRSALTQIFTAMVPIFTLLLAAALLVGPATKSAMGQIQFPPSEADWQTNKVTRSDPRPLEITHLFTRPTIDGGIGSNEWAGATAYEVRDPSSGQLLGNLKVGLFDGFLYVANDWVINTNSIPSFGGGNAWRFGTSTGPGPDNSGNGTWFEVYVNNTNGQNTVRVRQATNEASLYMQSFQPGSNFNISAAASFNGLNWQYELNFGGTGQVQQGPGPLPMCWHWEWRQLDPLPGDGVWVPVYNGRLHDPVKYEQPPDASNGLDVLATTPKILADDFLCIQTNYITDIHIWGSWSNDVVDPVPTFWIGIWSDVPSSNGVPSHPGSMLWSNWFYPGNYVATTPLTNIFEEFYNPNITNTVGYDTVLWQYNFYPSNPFLQCGSSNQPAIYWLSVTALTTSNQMFGWKTSTKHWHDDAVFGHVDGNGQPLGDWQELWYGTNSLNLAFSLTMATQQVPVTNIKFEQPPDTSTNGLDVLATSPKILADDFLCTKTNQITDIHVWGSWSNDVVDPNPTFWVGIWSDVPSSNGVPSHPGSMLWSNWFYPGDYVVTNPVSVYYEKFYNPNTTNVVGWDTNIWQYSFYPTNRFQQWGSTNNPIVYWVSVTAFTASNTVFGWKTSTNHWNDDAVFGHLDGNGQPLGDWQELWYWDGSTNVSLNLAFSITTGIPPVPPCTPPTNSFVGVPTLGPAPLSVTFTDLTTGTVDSNYTAFGDGGSINNLLPPTNFPHAYTLPGTYIVTNIEWGCAVACWTLRPIDVWDPYAWWATNYFGCTNCAQAAPTADPDGDGQNNLAEFQSGTNPTNNASVFRITSLARQANNVVITWKTAGPRTNVVQAAPGTANGSYTTNNFQDLGAWIILNGSGDTSTNFTEASGATNAPSRYYRIRLVQ